MQVSSNWRNYVLLAISIFSLPDEAQWASGNEKAILAIFQTQCAFEHDKWQTENMNNMFHGHFVTCDHGKCSISQADAAFSYLNLMCACARWPRSATFCKIFCKNCAVAQRRHNYVDQINWSVVRVWWHVINQWCDIISVMSWHHIVITWCQHHDVASSMMSWHHIVITWCDIISVMSCHYTCYDMNDLEWRS